MFSVLLVALTQNQHMLDIISTIFILMAKKILPVYVGQTRPIRTDDNGKIFENASYI